MNFMTGYRENEIFFGGINPGYFHGRIHVQKQNGKVYDEYYIFGSTTNSHVLTEIVSKAVKMCVSTKRNNRTESGDEELVLLRGKDD